MTSASLSETSNVDNIAINRLSQQFLLEYPKDAANVLEAYPLEEMALLLAEQSTATLVRIWSFFPPHIADQLLPLLESRAQKNLLLVMDTPDCAQTLNRLSKEDKQRCLENLPEDYANDLQKLLEYPERTAGQMLDPRVIRLLPDNTADDALRLLRKQKHKPIRKVFIVDADQQLQGIVDITALALSEGDEKLQQLALPPRALISPFDSLDEVADKLTQFKLDILPVIDINGKLLGAIQHPSLLRTLQDNSLTDIQAMVGVSREERALSKAWFAIKKRLPWMEINLVTAFAAASVVALFEDTIAKFTALAVLLPVVAGQSGNAGAQAQAVTIRGLALKEITVRNWLRVLLKEIKIGVVNGIAIALTTAIGVYIWSGSIGLSLVITIAMIISMVMAGMAGAVVPIVLTKLGQDPAQSSSIILTTITDIAGFMSFLGIATLLSALL
ncbi:magnesium transporter [Endozoicomonas sp. SM1973]|uniref:Magnesium transporter MgtE n=1 Tax=Spartinivicinus marinus TaxID=2994442 RepID=A0A853HZQ6_9GAMM|nr:magnesium transporter [Spartinivicinus marinus]MCX4029253.1 magnesium transporter [Spartinivicinus marinus]NYZ65839.1 magnesium transporter [Spartinivicinus marinus]